jgi:hypothetical protein
MAFDIPGAVGAGYSPDEIIDYLRAHPEVGGGFNYDGALKAGYSPAEIVDHLNPKADTINVQGIPILAPIDRGIAHLRAEGANLATDLGFPETGAFIRRSIPQATLQAPTSASKVSQAIGNRDYLGAIANVPSAVLEQAVPAAGAVTASLASGGSIPATAAVGAGIGALSQGDAIARQRANNNGRSDPNASDLAVGLTGGAATGAVGALGLGGLGGGAGQALKGMAVHTAADAAQPELASLAGSVGTAAGTQNASVPDMAAAGLTGMATRGALAAPAMARGAYGLTPAGQRGALADQFNAMNPDQQSQVANTAAAGNLLASVRGDAVPMPSKPTDPAVARAAGDLLDKRIGGLVDSLDRQGLVANTTPITDAWKAAADPGRPLLNQHLDALDGLGMDPTTTQTIKDTLTQRAMVGAAGVDPAPPSTLGAIGGAVSRVIGSGLHAAIPGPLAVAGNMALRPIGAALGTRFGMSDPALQTAATKATEMLQAAGQPMPDTLGALHAAMSTQHDVVQAQARLMGLNPASAVPAPEAAAVQAVKPAPGSPEAVATARAATATPTPPEANLTAPMPGMDGLSDVAKAQGALLPEWQYGLGKNLADALSLQGTPKPINMAQEVQTALDSMKARGWFDQMFSDALMAHNGRVTRGLYNVIRNEMLGNHGIDRRTLDAQASGTP